MAANFQPDAMGVQSGANTSTTFPPIDAGV